MTRQTTAANTAAKPTTQKLFDLLNEDSRRKEMASLCGKLLSVDRLFSISVNAVAQTQKLGLCTPMSLVRAVKTCAEWGLEPNTAQQHCYLIPRFNKVKDAQGKETKEWQGTAMLGWRGMLELFRRSGVGEQIWADVVYAGEPFRWRKVITRDGFLFDFEHDQSGATLQDAKILKAYAIAVFKGGAVQGVKLERWEIDKIALVSEAPNGPWESWEEEMAKKSAVRRLGKYLPMTEGLAKFLADDAVVEGQIISREDNRAPRQPTRAPAARALVSETHLETLDFGERGEPVPVQEEPIKQEPLKQQAPAAAAPKAKQEPEDAEVIVDDSSNDDAAVYEALRRADEQEKAKAQRESEPKQAALSLPSLDEQFSDGDITSKLLSAFATVKTRTELKRLMPYVTRQNDPKLATAYMRRQSALPEGS